MAITADMDRNMVGIEPADRRLFLWGLVVSAVLHALVALMLLEGVSGYTTQPLQDVVEVELLPPPPQEEETPPVELEQPEPEQPEQEEVETPEQPEPPEQEQAEEAPPPPPPPPASAREDLAETPEQPPEPSVLQEVTEFGEEDTGLQGEEETPPASAESASSESEQQAETDAQTDEAQAGETDAGEGEGEGEGQETEAAETEAPQEDASEEAQDTAAEDAADDSEAPEEASDVAETPEQPEALPEEAVGTGAETDTAETGEQPAEDFGIVGPIATNKTPAPKPPKPVASPQRDQAGGGRTSGGSEGPPAGMIAARELYSRDILDDPQARTAMRGMTEGQRLNLLCMTELREQIASVSSLPPELLPSFRPRGGNVLQPRIAAFRSLGRWFDVAFRCETDSGVTRVERFSFKIGKEIPQSQWLERGLTGF
ncbi:DUF930 domain-containing protein [Labrenzia sp. 5N]|uniref:DUF930 domain-containing protein n=1 Tax=Labrenzia sp. 5N TaxID=2723402 RepID=UPI001446B6F8|nr:DUF930 domain-containing protein [Labrenzia sp. 5N]NKX65481.1 DUF930 domain-containing protein [Labrenzia sp. 5N]